MSNGHTRYRADIDGLRALAVIPVVLFHGHVSALRGGFVGVDVFFIISGFLICSVIGKELHSGSFSIMRFYERRCRRILPALFAMFVVTSLLALIVLMPPDLASFGRSLLSSVLFGSNIFFWKTSGYFDGMAEFKPLLHTWSLSVEEQFYLVWPLLLLMMLRLGASRRTMAGVVIAGMVASAATRIVLLQRGATPSRIFFGTDAHADGLLAGALTGMLVSWGAGRRRVLDVGALAALGLMAVMVAVGWQADAGMIRFGYPALNLGAAVLVASLVTSPALRRPFEFGPLVWLGRISYGVYLWHIAVFWMLGKLGWIGGRAYWPAAIVLTIGLAAVSFYGLERPILRFKKRYQRVRSAEPVSA